jgi:HAMP domain-containing protein
MLKKLKPIQICSYCLRVGSSSSDPDGDKWHIDHVIPKTKYAGSSKDPFNLVKSCTNCNLKKSNKLGVMPQYGSLYADGTIHNELKEKELMLMVGDEYEVCLEPKNRTDISINQAANEHCVSIDTVRRAIYNGQINGVYKVKRKNGLQYFFPRNSANKLWRTGKTNDNSISVKECAEELGLSEKTVRRMIRKNILAYGEKVWGMHGYEWTIPVDSVNSFKNLNTNKNNGKENREINELKKEIIRLKKIINAIVD